MIRWNGGKNGVTKMSKKNVGRLVIALLLGLALFGGRPNGGSAHAELVSSNPVDGSTVSGPVTSVFLTFGEGVKHLNDLSIKDQTGKTYEVKSVDYAGKATTLNLTSELNNGKFSISWVALSDDGHLAPGSLSFTVGSYKSNQSQAVNKEHKLKAEHQANSRPIITYLLGFLLVVIIIGFFAILRRKKS